MPSTYEDPNISYERDLLDRFEKLDELEKELERCVGMLEQMRGVRERQCRKDAAARIDGKIDGIRLALSKLQQWRRENR